MRDLISNVGTDYVAFAVTAVLVLIVTLVYLWWVSPLNIEHFVCVCVCSCSILFRALTSIEI